MRSVAPTKELLFIAIAFHPRNWDSRIGEELYNTGGTKSMKSTPSHSRTMPSTSSDRILLPSIPRRRWPHIYRYEGESRGARTHRRIRRRPWLVWRQSLPNGARSSPENEPAARWPTALHRVSETAVDAAVQLCGHLAGSILLSRSARNGARRPERAQMICELVSRGKKIGITANSHRSDPQSDQRDYQGGRSARR